jgi:hypothetical protein
MPAGFALAGGLALEAAAFLVAGRLLLAADFLAAGFLAADFLAGAFSGLVLGSGYVSAWMRATCLLGGTTHATLEGSAAPFKGLAQWQGDPLLPSCGCLAGGVELDV